MKVDADLLAALEPRADADLTADLNTLRLLADQDPQSALNKIRYITEGVLYRLCQKHEVSWGAAEPTLERMIGPLLKNGFLPKDVGLHVRTIQGNASPGSHYQERKLSPAHLQIAQLALYELLDWFLDPLPEKAVPTKKVHIPRRRPAVLERSDPTAPEVSLAGLADRMPKRARTRRPTMDGLDETTTNVPPSGDSTVLAGPGQFAQFQALFTPAVQIVGGMDILRFAPLGDESITVGRQDDCALVLRSRQVSRHHAKFRLDSRGPILEDLGSANGTAVNGRPVEPSSRVELDYGDFIQIGPFLLQVDPLDPTETRRLQSVVDLIDGPERDPVTGLVHSEKAAHALLQICHRCEREHAPVTLLLVRVDPHDGPEAVWGASTRQVLLQSVSRLILQRAPQPEHCALLGSERIIVPLAAGRVDDGLALAEEIRAAVAAHYWDFLSDRLGRITVTIGVAERGAASIGDWLSRLQHKLDESTAAGITDEVVVA